MEHFKSHQEYFTKFSSNTSMKKQEEEHYKEHFKEQCMDNLKQHLKKYLKEHFNNYFQKQGHLKAFQKKALEALSVLLPRIILLLVQSLTCRKIYTSCTRLGSSVSKSNKTFLFANIFCQKILGSKIIPWSKITFGSKIFQVKKCLILTN